jgi:hypothetical protein
MNIRNTILSKWLLFAVILLMLGAGCSGVDNKPITPSETTIPPTSTISPVPTNSPAPPIAENTSTATTEVPSDTPTAIPTSSTDHASHDHEHEDVLYEDDFTTLEGSWPEFVFDNFYIGYHEPEWYHIEIQEPYDSALVVVPEESYEDFTTEVEVFVETNITEESGDFRYGLVFRRSGDQYYALTISPNTKRWTVLKNSPSEQLVMAEGTDDSIQGLEATDKLRVDARGEDLFFYINGHPVAQVSDPDYASGELGFYVETYDNPQVHIHYDLLTIQDIETLQPQGSVLYEDDFTTLEGDWPELVFDNFYIGYHEPEWYHVEVQEPNDDALVVLPEQSFDDFTTEVEVFVETNLSEPTGDFRYGLVFRRTGKQWYAFTISPRTQQWTVLKSSSSGLEVLAQGRDDNIHGLDVADKLRVDTSGPNFFFYIDGQSVSTTSDPDYTSGELGFFVQTFDSHRAHIHYDNLTIQNVSASQVLCNVVAQALYLREGPSTSYDPLTPLSQGTRFVPLGRNPDGTWIKVRVAGSEQLGWVANSDGYVSCNVSVTNLPVSEL